MALTQQLKGENNDDDNNKKSSSTVGSFPSVNNQQPSKKLPKKNSLTNEVLTSSSPTGQSLNQTIYNVDNIYKYSNTDEKVEPVEKEEVEKSNVISRVSKAVGRDVRDFALSFDFLKAGARGVTEGVAQLTDFAGDVGDLLVKGLQMSGGMGQGKFLANSIKDYDKDNPDQNPNKKSWQEELRTVQPFFGPPLERVADKISEAKDVIPEPKTVTGNIVELLAQYGTGYATWGKAVGGGFKTLYTKEFLTGMSAFDAEDELFVNFMAEMGYKIPVVTEFLAKEEEDPELTKRLKSGLEATLLLAPFHIPTVIKHLKKIKTHKRNTEQANKELLENGEVSETTQAKLVESAEALMDVDDLSGIKLSPKSAELAEKEGWTRNFAKVVETTEKTKLKKNIDNAEAVKDEVELNNEMVTGLEKKLTINKGKDVDDEDFVRVSKIDKFGKRVLDRELLVKAKNMELKDETLESAITDTGIEIDEFIAFDSAKRKYQKQGKKEEIEELFRKDLKQDNINALVLVAKKMREYEGGKYWQKTKKEKIRVKKVVDGKKQFVEETVDVVMQPLESIFNAVVKMGDDGIDMSFGVNHPLWDALQDAGLSFQDFAKYALGSVSEAGSTLGKFSQLSNRVKPKSLRQAESLERRLKSQGNFTKFIRRVLDIGRGLMVSAVATAARNLESGLLRSPVEALNNIVETATYDIANGRAFRGNRALKRETWQDSFRSQRYIYSDRKTAEEFTNLLLRNPTAMKFYDQMFNTINEIQLNTGRGSDMFGDKTLSVLEDFTKLVNTPNRWQDFMLRRATFLSEAELLFRKEWDMDLMTELKKGRLNDILNDARDLNPTIASNSRETIPALDILARATNKALDLTYANAPEINFNRHITEFIVKHNLTGFVAFPRFIFKSMELMAENSAGAFIPIMRRMYNTAELGIRGIDVGEGAGFFQRGRIGKKARETLEAQTGKKAGFSKYSQREHRMIARNVTGGLGIMASMMMLREDSDEEFKQKKKEDPNYKRRYDVGDNYKFVEMENGTTLDTSPIFPIRQMLFLGKMFNEYNDAKKDLEPDEIISEGAALEAITKTFDAREWLETFGGSDFRFGLGGNIIDEAADLFNAQDLMSGRYIQEQLGKNLGNFLSRYAQPFGQVLDFQRAMETRGTVYKETKKDPEIVNKGGNFPEIISPFLKELGRPFYRFDAGDMIFNEEDAPKRVDIFRPDGKERVGPFYKLTAGLTMYNPTSEEGKILVSYGLDDFQLSSKSKIPTIKNFENSLIQKTLPKIVKITETLLKPRFEKIYEKNRESLSQKGGPSIFGTEFGISKEQYVKKELRREVLKIVKSLQGNETKLTNLVKRQKKDQVRALLLYKQLTTEERELGNDAFVKRYKRQPLVITEETALKEIPNYENMNEKQKEDAIKKHLARDMFRVIRAGEAAVRARK